MLATSLSLKASDKPSFDLTIQEINEETLGEVLYFCQLTTAILGELMQVNTYNQPGVENQKKYTKILLNAKNNEKEFKQLNKMLKDKQNYEL